MFMDTWIGEDARNLSIVVWPGAEKDQWKDSLIKSVEEDWIKPYKKPLKGTLL